MATTANPETKSDNSAKSSTASNPNKNDDALLGFGWFLNGMVSTKPEPSERQYDNGPLTYFLEFQVTDGKDTHTCVIKTQKESEIPHLTFSQRVNLRCIKANHNQYSGLKLLVELID